MTDAYERVRADARTPGSPPPLHEWNGWSQEERDAYALRFLTPEEWEHARHKFTRAMVCLITRLPFFGYMVAHMAAHTVWLAEPREMRGDRFLTMATDGRKLYVWPQFCLYHTDKEIAGVLLHELFHNVLAHPARGMGYDPHLRNVAMDYAVNLMVNDTAVHLNNHPTNGRPSVRIDGRLRPHHYNQAEIWFYIPVDDVVREDGSVGPRYCIDERFRDERGQPMAWEQIYEILEQEGAGGGVLADDHGSWQPGERPDGSSEDEPFDHDAVQRWAADANAKTSAEERGSMPAGMRRMIDEWLHPPLPWYRLLQAYMKLAPADFGWNPGDVRFQEPMPWPVETPELTWVTFGFDTSGSMSNAEIAASVENARSLMRGYPGMQGRAYFWDAAVHDRMDLDDFSGVYEKGVGGGGGTSIAPQFAAVEEDGIASRTCVHVCFTDGYVDWDEVDPDDLPYDVLWVITDERNEPPAHRRYRWTRLETT